MVLAGILPSPQAATGARLRARIQLSIERSRGQPVRCHWLRDRSSAYAAAASAADGRDAPAAPRTCVRGRKWPRQSGVSRRAIPQGFFRDSYVFSKNNWPHIPRVAGIRTAFKYKTKLRSVYRIATKKGRGSGTGVGRDAGGMPYDGMILQCPIPPFPLRVRL